MCDSALVYDHAGVIEHLNITVNVTDIRCSNETDDDVILDLLCIMKYPTCEDEEIVPPCRETCERK